jgi:preprotein translocase subunit SecG
MFTLLLVIHILASFTMVGVILLQSGKGAEMGAAFGGSSQTLFGSRGATTFLSKVTVVAAAVFMLTALSLAVLSKERSVASSLQELQQSNETPVQAEPVPTPSTPAAPSSSDTGEHEQPHSQPSSPGPSNP